MVSEEGAGTKSMSTVNGMSRTGWTPVKSFIKPSVLAPFPALHTDPIYTLPPFLLLISLLW